MLVVLQDKVFNMDNFDNIQAKIYAGRHTISFFRGGEQCEYVTFPTENKRNKEWERIKDMIDVWYTIKNNNAVYKRKKV